MAALTSRHADGMDRQLLRRSHPLLYPLFVLVSQPDCTRVGRTVVVNDPDLAKAVLLGAPLDRSGVGTTGGLIRDALGLDALFGGTGDGHRLQRSALARHLRKPDALGSFDIHVRIAADELRRGGALDIVPLMKSAAAASTATLIGVDLPAGQFATLIDNVADTGARRLLGRGGDLRGAVHALQSALSGAVRTHGMLTDLLASVDESEALGVTAVAAVASYTTSVASSTRALAWLADADAWGDVLSQPAAQTEQLFARLTPTLLLPRRLEHEWQGPAGRWPAGARVVVNLREACRRRGADGELVNLAFGYGPRACPGSVAARRQLEAVLITLAPLAPVVVERAPGRRRALPRWDRLVLQASTTRRETDRTGDGAGGRDRT